MFEVYVLIFEKLHTTAFRILTTYFDISNYAWSALLCMLKH